jgi:hypothetical protein
MIFSKIEYVQHAEIHFSRRGNSNDTKIITVPIFDLNLAHERIIYFGGESEREDA